MLARFSQEVLRRLRKHMNSELKRLEDFRAELSVEGAPKMGALLCGAHHLEHSLREVSGPLLLLETTGQARCRMPRSASLADLRAGYCCLLDRFAYTESTPVACSSLAGTHICSSKAGRYEILALPRRGGTPFGAMQATTISARLRPVC